MPFELLLCLDRTGGLVYTVLTSVHSVLAWNVKRFPIRVSQLAKWGLLLFLLVLRSAHKPKLANRVWNDLKLPK